MKSRKSGLKDLRQIEDAPYQTFENGVMRPMKKADYLRIDEMKDARFLRSKQKPKDISGVC